MEVLGESHPHSWTMNCLVKVRDIPLPWPSSPPSDELHPEYVTLHSGIHWSPFLLVIPRAKEPPAVPVVGLTDQGLLHGVLTSGDQEVVLSTV